MNEKFHEQKEALIAIKHEINLLHQQVDFLLRNEKALGLLDLDVLMNRTHTLYDRLCSINVGEMPAVNPDDEEMDPKMINALFGVDEEDEFEDEEDVVDEEDEIPEEHPDEIFEEPIEDVQEPEETSIEPQPEEAPVEIQSEASEAPMEEQKPEDFGFIFKLETPEVEETPETPQVEETPKEPDALLTTEEPQPNVYTTGDEIEMTIPHIDTPAEEESLEPEPESEPEPEEIQYEPVIFGDMEEKEDVGFELEMPETLGDKLQQEEDHSLAAKLQNRSVHDLRSSIGINDKFLLVNELFSGSMEKYNRSIENLDDLKTLNGALIYLNELRIDLQWNNNNEAYKKLLELVHRKFEE